MKFIESIFFLVKDCDGLTIVKRLDFNKRCFLLKKIIQSLLKYIKYITIFLVIFFHKIHYIFLKKKEPFRQIQNHLLLKKINSQFYPCFISKHIHKQINLLITISIFVKTATTSGDFLDGTKKHRSD